MCIYSIINSSIFRAYTFSQPLVVATKAKRAREKVIPYNLLKFHRFVSENTAVLFSHHFCTFSTHLIPNWHNSLKAFVAGLADKEIHKQVDAILAEPDSHPESVSRHI